MAIICPGCTTELSPEATSCYVCTRPRSRNEIFKDIHGQQLQIQSRRRRPWIIAGLVLAAAGAGYGWWKLKPPRKAPAQAPAAAAQAPAGAEAGRPESLGHSEPVEMFPREQREEAPPPAQPQPTIPIMGPGSFPSEAAPATAPPPEFHKSRAAFPAKWKISGRVYDLLTLEPVAGASVTFTNQETGKRHSAKTGKDGRYSLVLPSLKEGAYAPDVAHPAYRAGFLEDGEVPYKEQGESRRIEAAQLLRENVIMHVPVSPPEGEGALTYDAVLTPVPR